MLHSEYKQALFAYKKWKNKWLFYKNEILPLLKEQREGALLAYKEGEINFASFTQIVKEAISSELEAQEAFSNYVKSLFNLQYYSSNSISK